MEILSGVEGVKYVIASNTRTTTTNSPIYKSAVLEVSVIIACDSINEMVYFSLICLKCLIILEVFH